MFYEANDGTEYEIIDGQCRIIDNPDEWECTEVEKDSYCSE